MGALEVVQNPGPGFYSRLFHVPKDDGTFRTIINLRALNHYVVAPKFKLETLSSCLAALRPGMFAVQLDLKDAYFQIMIHPQSRKYLRIAVQSASGRQILQFRALPFGLSSSPYIYTKIVNMVGQRLRLDGVKIFQYLDDWLIYSESRTDLVAQTNHIIRMLDNLGLVINHKKSTLVPTQSIDFLGANIDLKEGRVRPKTQNVKKILSQLMAMKTAVSWTAREWLGLLGTMNFSGQFVPLGRLRMRPFQLCLLGQWRPISKAMHVKVSR